MRNIELALPELVLTVATRGLGGVGIGLLLSDHLDRHQRRALGLGLLAVGVLSTVPLAARILPRVRRAWHAPVEDRSPSLPPPL